jgi:ubiquinone/menaquinone biosynthesis C-methylase UbiE
VDKPLLQTNFDRVAPFYDFFQKVVFGSQLQQAQVHFLNQISAPSKILVMGAGTGEFLHLVDSSASSAGHDFTLLDSSTKMCQRAKRIAGEMKCRVSVVCTNILEWTPTQKYDVVALPFVLDLFDEGENKAIVYRALSALKSEGVLIITDFVSSPRITHRLLLWFMYRFFGVMSNVPSRNLPQYELLFQSFSLKLKSRKTFVKGFVESKVYSTK